MEYHEFKKEVIELLKKKIRENVTVKVVRKNNDVVLEGLCIREKGRNISPVIYLNFYYRCYMDGRSMEQILDDIYELFLKSRATEDFDAGRFMDFNRAKLNIVFQLVSYKMNERLLKEVPHQKYLDLAVIFCCLVCEAKDKEQASILIRNEHLKQWGVTAKEVAGLAYENTPKLLKYEFVSMGQVLRELCVNGAVRESPYLEREFMPEMTILTNQNRLYGAACLIYPDVLAGFAKRMDSNLVILPSSVHEVILIPVKEDRISDREELCWTICEVNETQVEDTEILSDHPYFYNRMTAEISMA